MSRKLDLNASIEIVRTALGAARREDDLNPEAVLGDLIPNEAERGHFRQAVRKLVQERNFDIDTEAIPIFPHTTLKDVTHAITMSALPGDPYITKPDDEPPPPPKPKAARRKLREPNKKYEESN